MGNDHMNYPSNMGYIIDPNDVWMIHDDSLPMYSASSQLALKINAGSLYRNRKLLGEPWLGGVVGLPLKVVDCSLNCRSADEPQITPVNISCGSLSVM